jgi:hypothetical protein
MRHALVPTAALIALMFFALPATAQTDADREAVRAAVLDYVEGIYEVAPERIERSVHPDLAKVGWYQRDGKWSDPIPMSFERLIKLAGQYNKDGRVGADAPKEVEIYEVLDKTASVKLTAQWGIDYMHLVKLDGKWLIRNVLWQSHPAEE